MAKYRCYGKVVATKWLGTVEADSYVEALKLAMDKPEAGHVSVCHKCANEIDGPTIDEVFIELDIRA